MGAVCCPRYGHSRPYNPPPPIFSPPLDLLSNLLKLVPPLEPPKQTDMKKSTVHFSQLQASLIVRQRVEIDNLPSQVSKSCVYRLQIEIRFRI